MKLSKRELIMVVSLVFVVLIVGYWFLFLSPARTTLSNTQTEYNDVIKTDTANQKIIDSVNGMDTSQKDLKTNISEYEKKLLPSLKTEVIAEHIAKIIEKSGLKSITKIVSDQLLTDSLSYQNGQISNNSVQTQVLEIKVAGTDGITEGGIPFVGYGQFITAVKEIEKLNPAAIHISSISMEETNQGFQYFTITVECYAFVLDNRISEINSSEPYINWTRPSVPSGGIYGIPYNLVPLSRLNASYFRPFALVHPTNNVNTPSGTPVPSPTPTP